MAGTPRAWPSPPTAVCPPWFSTLEPASGGSPPCWETDPSGGTILLGHLHWDHTQGLPFFAAGDAEGASVSLLLPAQGADPAAVLERCMAPPHCPVRPADLLGEWTVADVDAGRHEIEGFDVLAMEIPHKGGRTFGYRVGDGRATIAYLSDHTPLSLGPGPEGIGAYHEAAMALTEGVDLLIHDAQDSTDELTRTRRRGFGHSAADYAVELARRCDVARVLLFHHDPSRTDAEIDAMVARYGSGNPRVEGAREGTVHVLPGG